ncbi:hypothetical protein [Microcoleus sp. PH2017_13_LAR_U_A]|uniref:hypothetical protein n=1 Tax=Microcoleus sp. PH2017_13_LAR_U_A TaxID=2798824 RepID=UPI0025CB9D21|nr:hypothetical protein [Microcoleus sp. PH2017_13_LAR_U_A]
MANTEVGGCVRTEDDAIGLDVAAVLGGLGGEHPTVVRAIAAIAVQVRFKMLVPRVAM